MIYLSYGKWKGDFSNEIWSVVIIHKITDYWLYIVGAITNLPIVSEVAENIHFFPFFFFKSINNRDEFFCRTFLAFGSKVAEGALNYA